MSNRLVVAIAAAFLAAGILSAPPADAAWPGLNGSVTFTRNGDVWTSAAGAESQLTNTSAGESSPTWSPDGEKLAFVRVIPVSYTCWKYSRRGWYRTTCTGNYPHVFTMAHDGSNIRQLTSGTSHNIEPAWTYDGRLLFVSNRDGDYEIVRMNADGSSLTQLTYNTVDDHSIAASPYDAAQCSYYDCTPKIAFTRYVDEQQCFETHCTITKGNHVFVMDYDGTDELRITGGPVSYIGPDWSPKRQNSYCAICASYEPCPFRLVLAKVTSTDYEIVSVNQWGNDWITYTDNDVTDFHPAYSPQGDKIVYSTNLYNDDYEIRFVSARSDVNQAGNVTADFTNEYEPDWQSYQHP